MLPPRIFLNTLQPFATNERFSLQYCGAVDQLRPSCILAATRRGVRKAFARCLSADKDASRSTVRYNPPPTISKGYKGLLGEKCLISTTFARTWSWCAQLLKNATCPLPRLMILHAQMPNDGVSLVSPMS